MKTSKKNRWVPLYHRVIIHLLQECHVWECQQATVHIDPWSYSHSTHSTLIWVIQSNDEPHIIGTVTGHTGTMCLSVSTTTPWLSGSARCTGAIQFHSLRSCINLHPNLLSWKEGKGMVITNITNMKRFLDARLNRTYGKALNMPRFRRCGCLPDGCDKNAGMAGELRTTLGCR